MDIRDLQQAADIRRYNDLNLRLKQNIGANAIQDLKDLSTGLHTAGSELIRPIYNLTRDVYKSTPKEGFEKVGQAFRKTLQDQNTKNLVRGAVIGGGAGSIIPGIGTVGGAITGGLAGLLGPENLANAVLSTYNTTVEDIRNRNVDQQKIAQGIYSHPIYAAMDISGLGGIGKEIGTGSKAVAKQLGPVQQLLPGSQLSELNRELTNSKLWSRAQQSNLYSGYSMLNNMPLAKRAKMVEHIVANTGDLKGKDLAVANQIKADLRANENELVRLGLIPEEYSKQNTIAQYVMENLRKDTNLLHKDIIDIIQGNPLRDTANEMLKDSNLFGRIRGLINEGDKLYSDNKIALLTHKLAPSKDPLGEVIARHVTSGIEPSDYARIIGRSTPEMLGDVLPDSLKLQLDRVANIREGLDVFNDVLNSKALNLGLNQKDKSNFLNAFRNSLKKDLETGVAPDLSKALRNSAIDTKVDATLYKAIEGAFDRTRLNSAFDRFLNNWKKTVLGTTSWVTGNRLGNWSLNAIEGVTLDDYIKANTVYKKYIPDVLKQQTSFNTYVNMGAEGLGKVGPSSAYKEPLTQIRNAIGRFNRSDKTLSDIGKLATELYGGTSNLTANPFFKWEASNEFIDRAANFVKQARDEAAIRGTTVEDILKKSKTDKELFLKLNTKVNKSLGDYIGRNYALPNTIQEALSKGIPFYRFPVQTARTTLHQIANRPAAFATNISIPARAGQDLYQGYVSNYNLSPEQYKGGVPYKILPNGTIRTMALTPSPIGIVSGRITNIDEFKNMLNPAFSNVEEALSYRKFGDKYPTSKRLTKYKLAGRESEYKPTNEERARFILNNILEATYNPYIQYERLVKPLRDLMVEKSSYAPYDIESFDINKESYKKTSPLEIAGGLIGISTRGNLPVRGKTKKQYKKDISTARRTRQKILQNKRGN